ncbi:hypothetical protein OA067_00960 [Gammaproteobacteria bacterium]|nr:hypothetical protein [Gammaproteobacteria bacterium]
MRRLQARFFIAWTILFSPSSVFCDGNLAQYPPLSKDIFVRTAEDGMPKLEPIEIQLQTAKYYRLTIHCPDVKDDISGWRIEMPGLLRNSHLRLVTVGDIEIHLQGMSFNAIECDEVGSANVSFVPIKPGRYELYVGNVPSALGRPIGEAGKQEKGKFALGHFSVR